MRHLWVEAFMGRDTPNIVSALVRSLKQGWSCSARSFTSALCSPQHEEADGLYHQQEQVFEELALDDITSLITAKCRLLANPTKGHDGHEEDPSAQEETDPVKIFQNCWDWHKSANDFRYDDSSSSALPSPSSSCMYTQAVGDSSPLSRRQRMAETAVLGEFVSSLAQKGWNPQTQEELIMRVSHLIPFHVCHLLKALQEPDLCLKIFNWARQQPGYRHTTRTYNALFGVLAGHTNAIMLTHLHEQMMQEGCEPDKVTLCTLIKGYKKAQEPNKVLELYSQLRESGWDPGVVTYSCIIDILAKHGYTDKAREVYFEMRMSGCSLDKTGYNTIINLFGRKKNLHMATRLFKDMCECGLKPDGYTYAALIQTHLNLADTASAYRLFAELLDKRLSVSLATCNALIFALGKTGELDLAMKVYHELDKIGLRAEMPTYSTLVNVFGQKERLSDLHTIIEDMASKEGREHDIACSNAVEWLVLGGNVDCARKLVLDFTRKLGGANNAAIDALLEGFIKKGAIDELHGFLTEMAALGFKLDAPKLSDFVKALGEAGNVDGALKMFYAMRELGYPPNRDANNSVIMCLSKFGSLFQALRFYDDMIEIGLAPSTDTCNHLIHILCIKGDMKSASDIFNKMNSSECAPNVGTYNQLIAGYANLGDWAMAFTLSKGMEDSELAADSETYLPLIFSLGNEGRMEHALQLCMQMLDKGLKPSSRVCIKLLDMLSRKCKKHEAVSVFTKLKLQGEFEEFLDYESYVMQRWHP